MARQDNHGREAQREPTWADVSASIGWLETTYGGHVECSIDVEGTRGASGALWVYARMWPDFRPHGEPPLHVARQLWPTNRHKTMTGCMYRLLHQLDHMMDAYLRAQSEGLPF